MTLFYSYYQSTFISCLIIWHCRAVYYMYRCQRMFERDFLSEKSHCIIKWFVGLQWYTLISWVLFRRCDQFMHQQLIYYTVQYNRWLQNKALSACWSTYRYMQRSTFDVRFWRLKFIPALKELIKPCPAELFQLYFSSFEAGIYNAIFSWQKIFFFGEIIH